MTEISFSGLTGIRFTVPFLNSFYIGSDKFLSSRTIHNNTVLSSKRPNLFDTRLQDLPEEEIQEIFFITTPTIGTF